MGPLRHKKSFIAKSGWPVLILPCSAFTVAGVVTSLLGLCSFPFNLCKHKPPPVAFRESLAVEGTANLVQSVYTAHRVYTVKCRRRQEHVVHQ